MSVSDAIWINELAAVLPPERLLIDPADCFAYSYDNSRKYMPPQAVAFALSSDEVATIMRICARHRVPVTPRGRGTGTAGGSIPISGGLLLSLERMNRVLELDPANRFAVVEAGVLNGSLQKHVAAAGFFWPPDPSSAAYCSIGGNLATNAGGPHTVKYGSTRDHVLGVKAVTAQGDIISTGSFTSKHSVAYDLTRLLIGSEGTLAIITEATLKLTPKPACIAGVAAHYRDLASCSAAIVAIMGQPFVPSALEFLDNNALTLLRNHYPDMLPPESAAMLMIEVDGSPQDVASAQQAIVAACRAEGLIEVAAIAQPQALWAARKALSPLLRDVAPKKINEDVVVPVAHLPALLSGVAAIVAEHGVRNVNFGHAGNGNIHVNLLIDPANPAELIRGEECLRKVFDLVISLRGALSGEHGVGQEKRDFVPLELDAPTLAMQRQIKQAFDPLGLLNPGKVLPAV
ncbi:MAG: hypothetical protein RL210_2068 [Pseudomonadota bacterium]|jgi:D-lactate dehydrogenase|nr:hypothetical protein [Pseudomonadota bacterium]